jgi:hypothetical protein
MPEDQADLLDALAPAPEVQARPMGQILGPTEGLAAGLSIWCGTLHGWRRVGELVGLGDRGQVIQVGGRLSVALVFDLGPARTLAEQRAHRQLDEAVGNELEGPVENPPK